MKKKNIIPFTFGDIFNSNNILSNVIYANGGSLAKPSSYKHTIKYAGGGSMDDPPLSIVDDNELQFEDPIKFQSETPISLDGIQHNSSQSVLTQPKPLVITPSKNNSYVPNIPADFKSKVNKSDNAYTALAKYMESPVFKQRLRTMYDRSGSNYSDKIAQGFKNRFNNTKVKYAGVNSYAQGRNVYIGADPNSFLGFLNKQPTLSHELGHRLYDPSNNTNDEVSGQEWYDRLRDNYRTHLKNINPTPSKVKNIYGDQYGWISYKHDSNPIEYPAFIYETREDMRQRGLWDYTTGDELTPEIYRKYLESNPNSRLGNYTDEKNALYLLNTTAYNPTKKSNSDTVTYAKRGRRLCKKFNK